MSKKSFSCHVVLRLESCGFMFIPLGSFGISPRNWAIKKTPNIIGYITSIIPLQTIIHGIFWLNWARFSSPAPCIQVIAPDSDPAWIQLLHCLSRLMSTIDLFVTTVCVCATIAFPNLCPNLWHCPTSWWSTAYLWTLPLFSLRFLDLPPAGCRSGLQRSQDHANDTHEFHHATLLNQEKPGKTPTKTSTTINQR